MSKCMIVAELSANHNHNLEIAKESIRAIADTGADAVKLQTYRPDSLTLPVKEGDFVLNGGLWDGRDLYGLYQEAFTPYEWHAELYDLARQLGLVCFSTPFDREAVDFLETLDNPIYEIASFEVAYTSLIGYAASKGKPMVISTGIASEREVREAIDACHAVGNHDITLLKCTSAYPARIEDAQLGLMPEMREMFGVKVGLSDHSPGSMLPVMSVALGGVMIEKHFILDRKIGGPDASFSMDREEFARMVREVRQAEAAMQTQGFNQSEGLDIPGRAYARSLYVSAPIRKGERFSCDNVACVRPGFSLHPRHLEELLTRTAERDYKVGDRLSLE